MLEVLRRIGGAVSRSLGSLGTPIDDKHSLYACHGVGWFVIVEVDRMAPGNSSSGGFQAGTPLRRRVRLKATSALNIC
jgi:hypothetical protein